jgi:phosphatidylinositol glycan class P protein
MLAYERLIFVRWDNLLPGVCYFFPKIDERTSSFGFSGDQGAKPSEVYGFVGSITTVVVSGIQPIFPVLSSSYVIF